MYARYIKNSQNWITNPIKHEQKLRYFEEIIRNVKWKTLIISYRNANYNQLGTTKHLSEWLKLKRLTIHIIGQHVVELEPSNIADGKVKRYNHFGNQPASFLIIHLSYDPDIPLLGIYPKETKVYSHTKTSYTKFKSFIYNQKHKKCYKQTKCPPTGKWITVIYLHNRLVLSNKRTYNVILIYIKILENAN